MTAWIGRARLTLYLEGANSLKDKRSEVKSVIHRLQNRFNAAVAEWITRVGGAMVTAEEVAALPLPEHLRVNFRVADLDG